jgi:hypothetical protein
MKKLLLAAVLVVACMLAYNMIGAGKIGSGNLSPEERRIQALEERIDAAGRQILQAGRAAGLAGIDSTADAEAALGDLDRVEKELRSLQRETGSEEIRKSCDRLLREIDAKRGGR